MCGYYITAYRDSGGHTYDVNVQYSAKDSKLLVYENVTPEEAQFSTEEDPTKPAIEFNVNMEENPSYQPVDYDNPQVKLTAEDNVNIEENPSYQPVAYPQIKTSYEPVDCDNPQVKSTAGDNENMEEILYHTVK